MPRKCQCCESEYRLQCDSRLKAGESPSALAAEFGLSVDALQRHAKNHLPKRGPQMTLVERLERALTRAESLVESCSQLGDHRGLDSALKSVTTIIESISKMRTQDVGKYESLSDSEK